MDLLERKEKYIWLFFILFFLIFLTGGETDLLWVWLVEQDTEDHVGPNLPFILYFPLLPNIQYYWK